jgi:pimeloyl-ACP methyl ester carboxylesterase
MDFEVAGTAKRAGVLSIAVALAACTTYVPLSQDYDGPDVLPADAPEILTASSAQSFRMTGLSETRERARFVVHELQLPSVADPNEPIAFEYYDVDGDARTPVVVLLPIFNGHLAIPRFFARHFANQGWAAVIVTRGRDPLDALTAPSETVRSNLQDYSRVLDWIERQPELDASRIGVFGVSLGAMDAVMLAALDGRVRALVIAMAGGDLSYLLANTNYRRIVRTIDDLAESQGTSREALGAKLDAELELDPLALAPYVDAERVLMIMTRTDAIIPFEAQHRLGISMGSPEALHLATGHRTSVVFFPMLRNAAFEFFARRFGEQHVALAMN